jgi:hypothetical protein
MLFALVVVGSFGRLSRLPSLAVRSPYVLFGLLYVLGFVFAFSSIENFGILARERCQLLPFAFVLICLPRKPKRERERPLLPRRAKEPAHLASVDR